MPTHKSILDLIRYDQNYKSSDIWTIDDIRLFITKFLLYPKDFYKISSFFYNKNTKDIVNFYFNFKFHFDLSKHTFEVEKPRYREYRRTNSVMKNSNYTQNYNEKMRNKKMEYIKKVADDAINNIDSKYYEAYEKFANEKFHQPVTRFTTFQLLKIFGHTSDARNKLQQRKREEMYEEARKRDTNDVLKNIYRKPGDPLGE